jgi:hypothetical protein
MYWVSRFLLVLLLVAGLSSPVASQINQADPLEVPVGAGQVPEALAHLDAEARVEAVESSLRERGYSEMPLLAFALLRKAERIPSIQESRSLVARAVALAPDTPSVRFKAGLISWDPTEIAASVRALLQNAPAAVWLLALLGGVVGIAALLTGSVVLAVAFVRSAPLHGHRFGHLTTAQDPPGWPGILLVISVLAVLPILGLGPIPMVAAAGVLAAMRMRLSEAFQVMLALLAFGLLLGPGLDYWSRLAAIPSGDPVFSAAWRVDRGQPLLHDNDRLLDAVNEHPGDPFLRVALATAWIREGDLDGADRALAGHFGTAPEPLHAHASNLKGILHLARGDVDPSIQAFETAQTMVDSAAVLYNLSQAHGRGLRLINQATYFKQARQLDPDLVGRYTEHQSSNIHRYLIHGEIPLLEYLRRGLSPSPDAAVIAAEIRRWVLGARAPDWTWMVLPAFGLLALVFRSSSIGRCARCERPVCPRCAPESSNTVSCARCARLFAGAERSDPRVRRRQMDLDRRRQRRIARTMAAVGLLLPGLARTCEGRVVGGAVRIFMVVVAGLLLLSLSAWRLSPAQVLPPPFEVEGIAVYLPVCLALILLVPLYVSAFFESARRLSTGYSG